MPRNMPARNPVPSTPNSLASPAKARSPTMGNITINMYMKAYNAYLDYRHEPRMKPMKSFDSVKRKFMDLM